MIKLIHNNSRKAHAEGRESGQFSDRQTLILKALRELGQATDRELCDYLELPDMNAVRPRCTELIKKHRQIEECGSKVCPTTGKTVRLLRITPFHDRNQQLLPL